MVLTTFPPAPVRAPRQPNVTVFLDYRKMLAFHGSSLSSFLRQSGPFPSHWAPWPPRPATQDLSPPPGTPVLSAGSLGTGSSSLWSDKLLLPPFTASSGVTFVKCPLVASCGVTHYCHGLPQVWRQ